ncbi:hypothetical protein A6M13_12980 [Caryophanon tenue]|uniref:Uncharacterized protein n=1 Tax=Caryophanon tenue TaxID=33978 RepID=A0A1C0YHK0_9BACL|nr:hypothetical protein A6M13_12980 [Caryophanon tenue]
MFVTSALPHDVAFLADVPLLKAHAPAVTRRRKTLLFLLKSPLVSEHHLNQLIFIRNRVLCQSLSIFIVIIT